MSRVIWMNDEERRRRSVALQNAKADKAERELATERERLGQEAVEQAGQFRPQVILMDIGMPKLNGYEATRRIREEPWGREMIVIALTGWGQEVDRANSREAGCDGHLVKPVNLPDLEKLLTELQRDRADPPR